RDPDAKPGEEGRAQERPPSRRHTLERPARGEWQYPAGRKPRDEPQHDPRRHAMREPHRQRRESDREQPPAQRRRQTHTHHGRREDRKSTRLNSSHEWISYAVFCLKKKRTMA